jgi:hypothetical protein
VHVGHSHSKASSLWTKFLQLKEDEKLHHMKKMLQDQEEDEDNNDEVEKKTSWSWRKLLESVFGDEIENKKIDQVAHKSPHSVNLYDRKPDFKNSYGWSVALDGSDYSPLKSSGIGIYHVNLKPVCKPSIVQKLFTMIHIACSHNLLLHAANYGIGSHNACSRDIWIVQSISDNLDLRSDLNLF